MSTAPSFSSGARSVITLAGFRAWILFCLAGISIYHCYTYTYNLFICSLFPFYFFLLEKKLFLVFGGVLTFDSGVWSSEAGGRAGGRGRTGR